MTRPAKFPTWATTANYPAGGNPWNGTPTRVDPGAGKESEGWDPAEQPPAQVSNWLQGTTTDWLQFLDGQGGGFVFGNGFDGNVTLDGAVAAPAGMSKVGTVYSLTRDFFAANLTVTGAAVVLKTNDFRLYVQGTLTTAAGGIIHNDGNAATGQTAGTGSSGGTLAAKLAGGIGGAAASGAGAAGSNAANSDGGAGGTGGTSTGAAGAGGTATLPLGSFGLPFVPDAQIGYIIGPGAGPFAISGGGGGGGGGGSVGAVGGGGGGGAGIMCISARFLNLSAATDIHCNGGAGGSGVSGASGGGGGGGTIILVYYNKAALIFSGAINCLGGTTGGGLGALPGQAGNLFEIGSSNGIAPAPVIPHIEKGMIIADGIADTFTATFAIAFELPILGVGSYRVDDLDIFSSDGTLLTANVINKALSVDGGGRPLSMQIKCQSVPAVNSEIYWEASQ